jgi:hypothetical protein
VLLATPAFAAPVERLTLIDVFGNAAGPIKLIALLLLAAVVVAPVLLAIRRPEPLAALAKGAPLLGGAAVLFILMAGAVGIANSPVVPSATVLAPAFAEALLLLAQRPGDLLGRGLSRAGQASPARLHRRRVANDMARDCTVPVSRPSSAPAANPPHLVGIALAIPTGLASLGRPSDLFSPRLIGKAAKKVYSLKILTKNTVHLGVVFGRGAGRTFVCAPSA